MPPDDESKRERATVPGFARAAAASVPLTEPPELSSDALAKTHPGPAAEDRSLGRFEIRSKLGEGGMGVVLLAVDPTLGRLVALKVLHDQGTQESIAARRRLLREAQGIAQLAHENVIVVHEVGTHAGRDYVAMEYVKGKTLGGWQANRSWREVRDIYIRAGRGLAAAHAAGLVHRDFKPDNVLVGDDGRVRVTDFGLVAAIGAPMSATTEGLRNSSELGVTLTSTGSIMGTPRYMAPEQHRGEPVDARADQFSFCASLYEALYGRPPFAGDSYEVLRMRVLAGELTPPPSDSEVPATIRDAVLRGLRHEATDRFASMTELLDALATDPTPPLRARSSRTWLAVGVVGVVAGGIAIGTQLRDSSSRPEPVADLAACPPAIDTTTLASPKELADLRGHGHRDAAAMLARDLDAWHTIRERVCTTDPATRPARLACLDGVLAHFRLFSRAFVDEVASSEHTQPFDAGRFLVDPTACLAPHPPTLLQTSTPVHREVMASALRNVLGVGVAPGVAADLGKRAASDPCAMIAARATLGPVEGESLDAVANAAELCGDDKLRLVAAQVALYLTPSQGDITLQTTKLHMLEAVAKRIRSADSDASVAQAKGFVALARRSLDEWILRSEEQAAALSWRGRHRARIEVMSNVIDMRKRRSSADDVSQIEPMLEQLRTLALKELGAGDPTIENIDDVIGSWMFARGQVDAGLEYLRAAQMRGEAKRSALPVDPRTRSVRGFVRDGAGHPIEGARVYAAPWLRATHAGILSAAGGHQVVTRSDGSFELSALPTDVMAAEHGELWSQPHAMAGTVDFVVEPTSEVRGRVRLDGIQPPRVRVEAMSSSRTKLAYDLVAPLQLDGSFVLRAPRDRIELQLVETQCSRLPNCTVYARRTLVVGASPVPLALEAKSSHRSIDVIVRSTVGVRVVNASIAIRSGHASSGSLADFARLQPVEQINLMAHWEDHVRPELAALVKPGDLATTVPDVPEVTASVCAIGLPERVTSEVLDRLDARDHRIMVSCKPFEPADRFVVIDVPPWPRFD